MPATPLHVIVIGGGLGGLCLAQGLKRAGVSVAVYERDRARTDRLQGYRIHINPTGSRSLHACLPFPLYEAFVATCGKGGNGFTFLTEQLDELLAIDAGSPGAAADPVGSHKSVSRITLRQVLLEGLDDVVHFDKRFARYERAPDGRVIAHFEDGTCVTGDLLVGADGAGSRVRQQLLPHAPLLDTGVLAIGGKAPLTNEVRALLPPRLFEGPASVVAPGGEGLFVAVQEFSRAASSETAAVGGNDAAATLHPGLLFDNTRDYVMWAFGARRETYGFGADPLAMSGTALQDALLDRVKGWHPRLQRLVYLSDGATVSAWPIRTAVPVKPWATTHVTLLGDAIHSMTPYQGIGANTALRDAALLGRHLVAAHHGEAPLLHAVHDYEAAMTRYGFAAVRSSKRALDGAVSSSPVALAATKAALRLVNRTPPIKRLLFGNFGNN